MSEHDFQREILDALRDMKVELATTNAELKGVVARMDTQAETIAQHQVDIGKLQIEIAERRLACPLVADVKDDLNIHILQCPLKARMDAVEDYVTAQKAKASEDARWISKLMPVVYAAGGIAVYLAAVHSAEMLKFLQR